MAGGEPGTSWDCFGIRVEPEHRHDYAFSCFTRGCRDAVSILTMETERGKQPSLFAIVSTILWSFLGIRRRAAHESQTVRLSPVQIVVAGVIGAALVVVALVVLVRVIVASAG